MIRGSNKVPEILGGLAHVSKVPETLGSWGRPWDEAHFLCFCCCCFLRRWLGGGGGGGE